MSSHILQENLQTLRQAAQDHDWPQCEIAVFRAYQHIPADLGLRVALDRLVAHLPAFESLHPDISWVRDWLDQLAPLTTPPDDIPTVPLQSDMRLYDADGVPAPGSKVYMDGISLMQEAYQTSLGDADAGHALELARGVIGSAISAQVFAFAAVNCPDVWLASRDMWEDVRITDEFKLSELHERNRVRDAFDDCTDAYQQDLWLSVAEQLAAGV